MKSFFRLCLFLIIFSPNIFFGQTSPETTDDNYSTNINTTLNIDAANGVLQNDIDSDGDNLTVIEFRINGIDFNPGQTANIALGSFTINSDGSINYVPTAGSEGSLPLIVYTVSDGSFEAVGNVNITILNSSIPIAADDYDTADVDTTLSVSAPGVLANDSYESLQDIEVISFTIGNVTYNAGETVNLSIGSFTLLNDGSYTINPSPGFTGIVPPILYTISNGIDNSSAFLFLTIQEVDDLIEIHNLISCNQGFGPDGNYSINYEFRIRNNNNAQDYHPNSLIRNIDFTLDLEGIFGTGCVVSVDNLIVNTTIPQDFVDNPYPNDFDLDSVNPDFIDGISSTFFNTITIDEGILYPRQAINISFCLVIDPFCGGRPNPTPSGSGIDFETIMDVTSSKGDSDISLLLTDFHTTETIVTGSFHIPEASPPVNPDGTYDYTNFVIISNDGNATANNVNFNMGLGNYYNNGLSFLTLDLTQVSGPTVSLNPNYDGDTSTSLLAPNISLAPGETIVIEVFYLLAQSVASSTYNFSQVQPSQTLGGLDGFDETTPDNRRLFTFVSWQDNLGNHVDRYYPADTPTQPSTNDQCFCSTLSMSFGFVSLVSCDKQILNIEESPNGILEHEEYTFQFILTNTSPEVDLIDLQLIEDLTGVCENEPVSFSTPEIISSTATTDPILNPDYDGVTDINIFNGNSGLLAKDETITIEMTVVFVEDCIGENFIEFSGIDPSGNTALQTDSVQINVSTDSDNDGISNVNDIDDDNDTILDIEESNGVDPIGDDDGDLIPNYRDIDFGPDSNNDGIVDSFDFDGDGVPNHFDLDSDNDGIFDIFEMGNSENDTNNDGRTDNEVGENGLDNTVENDDTVDATVLYSIINTDNTANPDYLDIDSDDDGIVDNIEAQPTDSYIAPSGETNENGLDNIYADGLVPVDTEGDTIFDYIDINSDDDIREDIIEGWDFDNDGIPETLATGNDDDNDGLDNAYDNDDTQVNPTNSQVPTDFPNVDYDVTPERDWREVNAIVVIISDVTEVEGNEFLFTVSLVTYSDNSILIQSTVDTEMTLFTTDGTDSAGNFNVATSPFDYITLNNTPVIIPAFTDTFQITIESLDDNISELDELFSLNAEITSNNTLSNSATGIGTILDDDMLPDITMNDDIVNEGEDLQYTVTMSNPSSSPVDVSIMSMDMSATAPQDYEEISTVFSIDGTIDPSNPNLSFSFSIPTLLDNLNEPDAEVLGVLGEVISNNIGIEDLTKTGTILDIDPNPLLVITNDVVVEGKTLEFTISLRNEDNEPMRNYKAIDLSLETVDITTTVNRDYPYLITETFIPALETSLSQQVTTINDDLNENAEFMNLRAEIYSEDISNFSPILNGRGTIKDNDIPNLFSPNNDGQSDVFRIGGLADFPNFKLVIIDRWGGEIYNYSNNGSLSPQWWDGTKNGNPVIEGVYFYTLDYNDGITKPKTGFIQLVR